MLGWSVSQSRPTGDDVKESTRCLDSNSTLLMHSSNIMQWCTDYNQRGQELLSFGVRRQAFKQRWRCCTVNHKSHVILMYFSSSWIFLTQLHTRAVQSYIMTNVAVHCTLCHCCGCWSLECCLYRTLDGQNGMENSEERLESLACIMNPTVLQSNWSMNEKFSKFMRLCSALHNIFIFYKYLRGLTGSPAADLALVVGFLFAFCHCFNNSHLQRIDLRKKC